MDDKKSFEAARAESIAANREFIQSNPEPLKRFYSHADDITIFGGFGGLERGWTETGPRLDWASAQFAGGSVEEKDLSVMVGANLACTVTIERYDARLKDGSVFAKSLRVTQLFRREPAGWRLVHRHADPLVERRKPS
jgi:ketosteroid isomerase-like protein